MKIHIVKQGDTLYELAQKYNVELDKLIAANPQLADPNVLEIGMKVKIPDAPKPVAPPSEIAHKHVVVQGDTLWKLGKAWGVPLPEMIAANPHLKNPNVLMTGETVFIPKKKDGSNTEANVVNPPKPDTSVLPSAEALPQQLPAEVNVEQAPNIEMEVQSAPNVLAETPPAPIQAELPAFPNVNFEPFAQPAENPNIPVAPTQYMQPNIQEMQPHVQGMQANVLPYANVPMAEAVPPFQQYNVPAAEAFSANVQKAESNEWKEQTPPQLPPLPASVLPAYTGNLPPYPAAGGDCGCGGPALPTFPHAMPYSNYPVAGAYDPNVMAAQSNHPVAGAYDPNVMAAQSNYPVAGAYDPNVMAAQSNYPVAGAYDPNVMAAQSNHPVAGAYDPNVMAAQSNDPVAGAYDPNVMAAQSNYPVAGAYDPNVMAAQSNYPVAGAYDPNVMAAQSNYPVAGAYDPNVMAAQSNHPVAGAYDPNVMAAQSNHPVAGAYDPNVMAAQSNHPVAGAYDPNVMAAQSNYPVGGAYDPNVMAAQSNYPVGGAYDPNVMAAQSNHPVTGAYQPYGFGAPYYPMGGYPMMSGPYYSHFMHAPGMAGYPWDNGWDHNSWDGDNNSRGDEENPDIAKISVSGQPSASSAAKRKTPAKRSKKQRQRDAAKAAINRLLERKASRRSYSYPKTSYPWING